MLIKASDICVEQKTIDQKVKEDFAKSYEEKYEVVGDDDDGLAGQEKGAQIIGGPKRRNWCFSCCCWTQRL